MPNDRCPSLPSLEKKTWDWLDTSSRGVESDSMRLEGKTGFAASVDEIAVETNKKVAILPPSGVRQKGHYPRDLVKGLMPDGVYGPSCASDHTASLSHKYLFNHTLGEKDLRCKTLYIACLLNKPSSKSPCLGWLTYEWSWLPRDSLCTESAVNLLQLPSPQTATSLSHASE